MAALEFEAVEEVASAFEAAVEAVGAVAVAGSVPS